MTIADSTRARILERDIADAVLLMMSVKKNGIAVLNITSSAADQVVNGIRFRGGAGFRLRPPKKQAGVVPVIRLDISNIGQEFERILLEDTADDTVWTVNFFHTLGSDTSIRFEEYRNFYVHGAPEYDLNSIRFSLTPFDVANRRFGPLIFDTEITPGAHPR